MQYRPEIDGLRALAVIPVLLFHAGFGWIPGGYLGVDVFFVISGYLITSILLEDLRNDRFSIGKFYERRARRILPALLVVLLATLAAAPFFSWKWQLQEIASSAVATLSFVANHFFFETADYFRTDAESYPLLHMWSLAVEEQYYFFIPLLLLGAWRLRPGVGLISTMLIGITLASLAYASRVAPIAPEAAFYLLPFRAYELGVGSLAALVVFRRGRMGAGISRHLGAAGILMIVASYLALPTQVIDPWLKLPLLMGTAAVMMGTFEAGWVRTLLAAPLLRGVGLISFSLYLWHQPVLAYARLHFGHVGPALAIALLGLSTLLAWATYRFVEQPFRKGPQSTGKVLRVSGLAMGAMAAAALFVHTLTPPAEMSSPQNRSLAASVQERQKDLWAGYKDLRNADFKGEGEKVLIVGDSFSQDFWMMARSLGAFEEADVSIRYIAAICQPYIGPKDISTRLRPQDRARCKNRAKLAPRKDVLSKAETVILAASWRDWSAPLIDEIVADYEAYGAEVIVIGRKLLRTPGHAPHARSYLAIPPEERRLETVAIDESQIEISRLMKSKLEGRAYVDFFQQACNLETMTCPIFDEEGYIATFDGVHLTKEGAAFFAPRLFQHPSLARFLPSNASPHPINSASAGDLSE